MNPDLQKALADLANRLGTTADKLWPVLVAHGRMEAVVSLVVCAAYLVAFPLGMRKLRKLFADGRSDYGDVVLVSCYFFGGLLFVFCVVGVCQSVADAVYPQAAALHELVGNK